VADKALLHSHASVPTFSPLPTVMPLSANSSIRCTRGSSVVRRLVRPHPSTLFFPQLTPCAEIGLISAPAFPDEDRLEEQRDIAEANQKAAQTTYHRELLAEKSLASARRAMEAAIYQMNESLSYGGPSSSLPIPSSSFPGLHLPLVSIRLTGITTCALRKLISTRFLLRILSDVFGGRRMIGSAGMAMTMRQTSIGAASRLMGEVSMHISQANQAQPLVGNLQRSTPPEG
jgi:hypothetical protein